MLAIAAGKGSATYGYHDGVLRGWKKRNRDWLLTRGLIEKSPHMQSWYPITKKGLAALATGEKE